MSSTPALQEGCPMAPGESVTQWIERLKGGDREAVGRLLQCYLELLVEKTSDWLRQAPRQAADEEDIALNAFYSFCRRAEQGSFPRLNDRNDLWQLLLVIAFRKTCNQIIYERRRRPRNGKVIHIDADDEGALFAEMISREPNPEMAAQTAEECRRLLAELDSDELREVALWTLEGYTNEEIAPKMNGGKGRSKATVERKLKEIRLRWEKEVNP
jgi:DNA-directed RNA polymerase specialized sigma24 family protein